MRLAMTAWPASGDSVALSDSNFGHVTILPVMPVSQALSVGLFAHCSAVAFAPGLTRLAVGWVEIGQASKPVAGSMVPAKEFDKGMLNASWVSCPVKSPS